MERPQGKGGMWGFLRGRHALLTSPGPGGSTASDELPFEPPSQVPASWDPMASWLPQTPANAHPPAAAGSSTSSSKQRGIFAAAWGKVKRRFGRSSGSKAASWGRGGSTEAGERLSAARPSPPLGGTPGRAAALHTTGSAPTPAATLKTAFEGGSQTRIPKPPSGASNLGGRSASGSSAHSSAAFSRLPQAAAPPARVGQDPAQRLAPMASGGASPDPVRRLAFGPAASGGKPGPAAASQPVAIAAAGQQGRQGPPPGWQPQAQQAQQRVQHVPQAQQRTQQHAQHEAQQRAQPVPQQAQQPQQQQQRPSSGQLPPLPRPQQQAGTQGSRMRRAGSLPEPSSRNGGMPAPYATSPLPLGAMCGVGVAPSGSSWGSSGGFAAQQLQLLGVPARSGLAGRWLREGGSVEGDGGAEVDFVLQIPQLQAAAREATRHLKVRAGG